MSQKGYETRLFLTKATSSYEMQMKVYEQRNQIPVWACAVGVVPYWKRDKNSTIVKAMCKGMPSFSAIWTPAKEGGLAMIASAR